MKLVILLNLLLTFQMSCFALASEKQETERAHHIAQQMTEEIDAILIRATTYRNAVITGQAIIDIMKSFAFADLIYIEGRLRKLNRDQYLVAIPKSEVPDHMCITHPYDYLGLGPFSYFLWITVNGEGEAKQKMLAVDSSDYEENLSRLSRTGFLSMDCK